MRSLFIRLIGCLTILSSPGFVAANELDFNATRKEYSWNESVNADTTSAYRFLPPGSDGVAVACLPTGAGTCRIEYTLDKREDIATAQWWPWDDGDVDTATASPAWLRSEASAVRVHCTGQPCSWWVMER